MPRRNPPVFITFERAQPDGLIRAIAERMARGAGWINIHPALDQVDERALGRPGFFSARGPTVPLGTFVAGSGTNPHQLGLEHAGGRGAWRQLRDLGVELPEGSRLVQDHTRRGLIIAVAPDSDPARIASFLLEMAVLLTPIPLPQDWVAEIYEG